jgi:hypothetical protein
LAAVKTRVMSAAEEDGADRQLGALLSLISSSPEKPAGQPAHERSRHPVHHLALHRLAELPLTSSAKLGLERRSRSRPAAPLSRRKAARQAFTASGGAVPAAARRGRAGPRPQCAGAGAGRAGAAARSDRRRYRPAGCCPGFTSSSTVLRPAGGRRRRSRRPPPASPSALVDRQDDVARLDALRPASLFGSTVPTTTPWTLASRILSAWRWPGSASRAARPRLGRAERWPADGVGALGLPPASLLSGCRRPRRRSAAPAPPRSDARRSRR